MESLVRFFADSNVVYVTFQGPYQHEVVAKTMEAFLEHPKYQIGMNGIGDFTSVDFTIFNFSRAALGAMRLMQNIDRIGNGTTLFVVRPNVSATLGRMFLQIITSMDDSDSDPNPNTHTWLIATSVDDALAALNLAPNALKHPDETIEIHAAQH